MNDDTVISVENLGKKYKIRRQTGGRRYTALRDVLAAKASGFLIRRKTENLNQGNLAKDSAAQRSGSSPTEDFWALKDVSFKVRRGDVMGVIGRNGAGKSTLLKILSRITEPTEGRVRIKGRVASLLEVGTGFHPELTGRENIFLNGAILGMNRAEIKKKFDEIAAFAEVEKFLDTPVKRYSSGMYLRLAFAVASHLEPDILVVDEVLAVGDAAFQQKCLGKMREVAGEDRTVLFVSHNLPAILNLCGKGLLLSEGRVALVGGAQHVCQAYGETWQGGKTCERLDGLLRSVSLADATGAGRGAVMEGEPLCFSCGIRPPEPRCLVSLIVRDAWNAPLFDLFDGCFSPPDSHGADVKVLVEAGSPPLLPGRYTVDFWIGDCMSHQLEKVDRALEFDVVPSAKTETSSALQGSIRCKPKWRSL